MAGKKHVFKNADFGMMRPKHKERFSMPSFLNPVLDVASGTSEAVFGTAGNIFGSALGTVGVGSTTPTQTAPQRTQEEKRSSMTTILVVGAVIGGLFVLMKSRQSSPVFPASMTTQL